MITLKENSKKGKRFIKSYESSKNLSIHDCYINPSQKKIRAEALCKQMMDKENGHGFVILSYNTMQFSCGWITIDGLRIETHDNSYIIPNYLPF